MAEVLIYHAVTEASRVVADHVAHLVDQRPGAVLGVPSGASPRSVAEALADHAAVGVDFSDVTIVGLDEYMGLDPADPRSLTHDIVSHWGRPLRIARDRIHLPDAMAERHDVASREFEAVIESLRGVDVQIVGIGADGHLGFNEPGSSFGSLTRVTTLTERTRRDAAATFGSIDAVPRQAITQGLGTILRARHIVLIAWGEAKAAAVKAAVEGPVTSSCPGSAIQLHPHVTVVVDEAAASALAYRDYYREAQSLRPPWQEL